jgi:hypothetical protein
MDEDDDDDDDDEKRCLPHVSSTFKKISPKIFGPHCVYDIYFVNILLSWCNSRQRTQVPIFR